MTAARSLSSSRGRTPRRIDSATRRGWSRRSLAAQIPCHYCVYFHTAAAKANGATEEEIREAVAMAAIVRHWSTVLNGMQVDLDAFKRETDTILKLAAEKAKTAGKTP